MYHWKLQTDRCEYEGYTGTLHAAVEQLITYAYGRDERDFYINGHHMNEEFSLWISGDKIVDDFGGEFVPCERWYDLLGDGGEQGHASSATEARPALSGYSELVANVAIGFNQIFRPQPTRGSAPTNPATLLSKGEGV